MMNNSPLSTPVVLGIKKEAVEVRPAESLSKCTDSHLITTKQITTAAGIKSDKVRKKKPIHGIFLLNKPQGVSSNFALQKVKHLFSAQKAGHSGSLDPLATGMLPICLGEATKVCSYLLDADKCYEATGVLGINTDSADSTGQIIRQVDDFQVSKEQLMTILSLHQGSLAQTPSMFSALKHNGVPLYRLARKGIEIPRKARAIQINRLQLDDFDGINFSLTIECSKGTYIRNLVEDIGNALQVGAHVSRLHRCHTSGFQLMPMYTLDQLEAMNEDQRMACLLPMDKAVDYMMPVILGDSEVLALRQGKRIKASEDSYHTQGSFIRLYDERNQLIGLGQLAEGEIKVKRLLSFQAN